MNPTETVEAAWDFTDTLPRPRLELRCLCGATDEWLPRYWRLHTRPDTSTVEHRCDVSIKCTRCSHVAVFGLAITPVRFAAIEHASGHRASRGGAQIPWQQAARILHAAGAL